MKFVRGTIIGAAIGAVGALLLAPKKGAETRKDLQKKGKELANVATEKAGDLTGQLQKGVGLGAKSAGDLTGQVRKSAGRVAKTAQKAAGSVVEVGKEEAKKTRRTTRRARRK